jgi:hypothetical protein
MSDYEPIDGPCAACGRADEVCCDHAGKPYCHDCWHKARGSEQPYNVVREDGSTVGGGSFLKEEAEELARGWMESSPWHLTVVPAPRWWGERIAHPGYLDRRREAILATLPGGTLR